MNPWWRKTRSALLPCPFDLGRCPACQTSLFPSCRSFAGTKIKDTSSLWACKVQADGHDCPLATIAKYPALPLMLPHIVLAIFSAATTTTTTTTTTTPPSSCCCCYYYYHHFQTLSLRALWLLHPGDDERLDVLTEIGAPLVEQLVWQGPLNYLFGGDQTWCKCRVILRDLPYNSALFELVIWWPLFETFGWWMNRSDRKC